MSTRAGTNVEGKCTDYLEPTSTTPHHEKISTSVKTEF